MPSKTTLRKAKRDEKEGKKPTIQAGEFIREEMHKMEEGSGNVRSRKQAIAVGLSEARRAGVKLGAPSSKVSPGTRKKAAADNAVGSGEASVSKKRSAGARKAGRTREKRYGRAG